MSVRKNIKKTTLNQYTKDYVFDEKSHIRKTADGRMYLPAVYCHNGHKLMTDDARFDGLRGVKLLVKADKSREIIVVSPFLDDQRKEGANFPEGTHLQICCPTCQEELEKLIPCTCGYGAYRRALYLTPNPKDMGAIGVCDTYGCPQSFINEDGELLFMVETEE
ncbi:MAG: hypothetical protein HY897_22610 [Deltaproteobacteria bacterium]|nr:hypothetical protein [Deltaproteobacteria bacterium]